MARGRKPRTWVKMDCEGLLRGSINYLLTLEGQAVWLKMIALAETSGGRPGYIEDNNQNGLPLNYVAQELHCTPDLLDLVIEKMTADKAIDITKTGSIHLLNFKHYQFGAYDEQKPYRQGLKEKAEGKVIKLLGFDVEESWYKELETEYAELDLKLEEKRCFDWWTGQRKTIKNAKNAFRNWCINAVEFKKRRNGGSETGKLNPRQVPSKYTKPEDL